MRRYYQILGVSPTASQEQIKAAWKFSLKAFHPDKFAGSSEHERATAEARTRAINEAYATLSDPAKRATYDQMRGDESPQSAAREPSPQAPQSAPRPAAQSKVGWWRVFWIVAAVLILLTVVGVFTTPPPGAVTAVTTPGAIRPTPVIPPSPVRATPTASPIAELPTNSKFDLPELARQARPAVVLILGLDASGKVTQTGSGFFISNDGRVVTNWHVVQNTHSIQAKTEDGAIYNVEGFLAWSASLDLAVLKAQAKRVPYLELETAATPDAGARIAVIGSPLALEGTLSEGIVSALRSDDTGRWLQITAPISPGSSGSPVLDTTGHVVGVATLNSSGRNQSLNFARSSQDLADLLKGIASDKRPESLKEIALSREREVESDPDFLLAMQALEKLDYTTALKHLNIARRRYPESPTLRVHIGGTYCGLELYDDAVQILRTVVSDVPTDEYAWMTMALALGQLGHGPEAIKASKQAVKLAPDNADAWERLGHCQVIVKDWTAAKTAFERAAKLAPRNPDYLLTLSYILAITGDAAGSKRAKEAARLATEARRKPSPTPSPGAEPTVPSSTDPSADSVTPSADTTKVYRVEGLPKSTPFLNVRSGPGAKYKILGKLTPGTSPIRCGPGRVANGDTIWQEIINPAHGWVNAQYLKPLE